jgi:formate dehydrogenase subunit gamma
MLWSVALVLGISMALPLTGMLLLDNSAGQAVAQQQSESQAQDSAATVRAEEQRRDFWRQARGGSAGYSAVTGPEAGVLIQSGGDVWRSVREGPVKRWGGILLIVVLAAIILFHLVAGSVKLEQRTGRTITRWSLFERVIHWYTAILFIILAITGLSLLFGRTVLIPVMSKEGVRRLGRLRQAGA